MPQPKPNEKENEYISRCVKQVMAEGSTQEQALGKCYGMYRQAKKNKAFKSLKETMKVLKERVKNCGCK